MQPTRRHPPPEPDLYPDLDEELREAVEELAGLDLNEKGDREDIMKVRTKRINYVPVAWSPIDVPTVIHASLAMLEPGTQLSTITSSYPRISRMVRSVPCLSLK